MTTTHPPRPQVTAEIPAVPLTTEGYSVLHQMMRLRWPTWRALPAGEKSAIAKEASDALAAMEKNSAGQSALFSLIGHKGDLMLIHFRESVRRSQSGRTSARQPPSQRLPRAHHILSFHHRTRTLRFHSENLQRTDRPGHRASFRSVESRNRVQAEPPSRSHAPAPIS